MDFPHSRKRNTANFHIYEIRANHPTPLDTIQGGRDARPNARRDSEDDCVQSMCVQDTHLRAVRRLMGVMQSRTRSDLKKLCEVSKFLAEVTTPYLYKSVILDAKVNDVLELEALKSKVQAFWQ
jgi:hypothetical protein